MKAYEKAKDGIETESGTGTAAAYGGGNAGTGAGDVWVGPRDA